MISQRYSVLLILFFSSKVFAMNFPVEIFEYINDTKVVVFISESDIHDTRQWQPLRSAPPLTLNAALVKIQKYLVKEKLGVSNAVINEIELKQIPHYSNYWHYLIKLELKRNNIKHYYYFVVLMNGKVIPAVKEVESFK